MSNLYTDAATGRQYTVDPATGQSVWVTEPASSFGHGQPTGKKRHPIRNTLLAVFAVLAVIGGVGAIGANLVSAGRDSASTAAPSGASQSSAAGAADSASAATRPASKVAGIGTPVRDGKFQFTVVKVKSGVAKIGNQYLNQTAQGQFVLVTLKVENIGTEAQLFDGSSQLLFDSRGRRFDADSAAAMYLGDQSKSFLNSINPGNAVVGIVVFDVPKGARLAKLELHDSPFSGGVEVAL